MDKLIHQPESTKTVSTPSPQLIGILKNKTLSNESAPSNNIFENKFS